MSLFGEMIDAGVSADSFTYNSVATAYAKDGRWQEAVATFREMSEFGFTGDVFSYTAGEAGGREKGRKIFVWCPQG